MFLSIHILVFNKRAKLAGYRETFTAKPKTACFHRRCRVASIAGTVRNYLKNCLQLATFSPYAFPGGELPKNYAQGRFTCNLLSSL